MTEASGVAVADPLELDHRVVGQTFLSKFDKCRRDAYLYRKFPGRSHQMNRGIAFHGGIDRAIEFMIENEEATMPGEVAKDFVQGYMEDHSDLIIPESERDYARGLAYNWGENFILDLEHLVGHEIAVALELDGWLLRCRIDLVYAYPDHVQVKDWKTSRSMKTYDQVSKDFQGKFYSLAALEGSPDGSPFPLGAGLNDVDFELVYPNFVNDEHNHLEGRGAPFDRKDLQDFKEDTLRGLIAALEENYVNQEWEAMDGTHCSECAAQPLCPIAPDLRKLPEITNLAEAQEWSSRTQRMERELKRAKKGLKGWVSGNGDLYVGDQVWSISRTEKNQVKSWPKLEDGITKAVTLGEDFDLADHRKKVVGSSFGLRKQTPDELENQTGGATNAG